MRLRLRPDRAAWPAYDLAAHRATVAQGRQAYRNYINGQPYQSFTENTRLAAWFLEGWQKEAATQQQQRWEDALIESGKDFALQSVTEDPSVWRNPAWV